MNYYKRVRMPSVQWDVTTRQVSLRDVLGRSEVNFERFRALKVAIKEGKSLRVRGERKKRREKAFFVGFAADNSREQNWG